MDEKRLNEAMEGIPQAWACALIGEIDVAIEMLNRSLEVVDEFFMEQKLDLDGIFKYLEGLKLRGDLYQKKGDFEGYFNASNSYATATGIYRALREQGRLPEEDKRQYFLLLAKRARMYRKHDNPQAALESYAEIFNGMTKDEISEYADRMDELDELVQRTWGEPKEGA